MKAYNINISIKLTGSLPINAVAEDIEDFLKNNIDTIEDLSVKMQELSN